MGCGKKKKKKIKMAETVILLGEHIMTYGFRGIDLAKAGDTINRVVQDKVLGGLRPGLVMDIAKEDPQRAYRAVLKQRIKQSARKARGMGIKADEYQFADQPERRSLKISNKHAQHLGTLYVNNLLDRASKRSFRRKYGNRGTAVGGLGGAAVGAALTKGNLRQKALGALAGGAVGGVGGRLGGALYGNVKHKAIKNKYAREHGLNPIGVHPFTRSVI